jgi:hypothetical protein
MLSDRWMTVQMIADELQIGKTSIYLNLMEDLEMRKICAKIVPKLLTPEQKLQRKQCCIDWKALEERDVFLERVVTGDKSWIYEYDIQLKSTKAKNGNIRILQDRKSMDKQIENKSRVDCLLRLSGNCAPQIRT